MVARISVRVSSVFMAIRHQMAYLMNYFQSANFEEIAENYHTTRQTTKNWFGHYFLCQSNYF